MRYAIAAVIALAALAAALAAPAADADDATSCDIGDFTYTLNTDSGTAEITTYIGEGGAVTFPATAECGGNTFTVSSIAEGVLGEKASAVTSAAIESEVQYLPAGIFRNCTALETVTFPSTVALVPIQCFDGCTSLRSVSLGNITIISDAAFRGCTALEFSIPETVTQIGSESFSGCSALDAQLPSGLEYLGPDAFSGCVSLSAVFVPGTVRIVGAEAFYGCTWITDLTLGGGVANIRDRAFYGCTGIASVTLPSTLTALGSQAFGGCSSVTGFESDSSAFTVADGVLFDSDGTTLIAYPAGKDADSYAIPSGVDSIEGYAFRMPSSALLKTIDASTLASVPSYSFAECASAVSIILNSSVSSIGNGAFSGCASMTGIDLGDSLARIPVRCFEGCTSLTEVTVPASVTEIRSIAFSGTSGLRLDILSSRLNVYSDAFSGAEGLRVNTVLDTSSWGSGITVNQDLFTMTVVLTDDSSYEVQFHAGDATDLETPVRAGYGFVGWIGKPAVMPAQDISVSADWTRNIYYLAFDANGGTGSMEAQTVLYGINTPLKPCAFDKSDGVFAGWSLTADGSVVYTDEEMVTDVASQQGETVILYAVWAEPDYIIVFNANGGEGEMANQSFAEGVGRILRPNTFQREGFTFEGWALTADGSVVYTDGQFVTPTSDMVLYAVWGGGEPADGDSSESAAAILAVFAGTLISAAVAAVAYVRPRM